MRRSSTVFVGGDSTGGARQPASNIEKTHFISALRYAIGPGLRNTSRRPCGAISACHVPQWMRALVFCIAWSSVARANGTQVRFLYLREPGAEGCPEENLVRSPVAQRL